MCQSLGFLSDLKSELSKQELRGTLARVSQGFLYTAQIRALEAGASRYGIASWTLITLFHLAQKCAYEKISDLIIDQGIEAGASIYVKPDAARTSGRLQVLNLYCDQFAGAVYSVCFGECDD